MHEPSVSESILDTTGFYKGVVCIIHQFPHFFCITAFRGRGRGFSLQDLPGVCHWYMNLNHITLWVREWSSKDILLSDYIRRPCKWRTASKSRLCQVFCVPPFTSVYYCKIASTDVYCVGLLRYCPTFLVSFEYCRASDFTEWGGGFHRMRRRVSIIFFCLHH